MILGLGYLMGPLEAACMLRWHSLLLKHLRRGVRPEASLRVLPHIAQSPEPLGLPLCTKTLEIAKAAALDWAPSRHYVYSTLFRRSAYSLMLVRQRLLHLQQDQDQDKASTTEQAGGECRCQLLPYLPTEIWMHIINCGDRYRSLLD